MGEQEKQNDEKALSVASLTQFCIESDAILSQIYFYADSTQTHF